MDSSYAYARITARLPKEVLKVARYKMSNQCPSPDSTLSACHHPLAFDHPSQSSQRRRVHNVHYARMSEFRKYIVRICRDDQLATHHGIRTSHT